MAGIRKRGLPAGWYPSTAQGVTDTCREWQTVWGSTTRNAIACVAPHAGWGYSGGLAFRTISHLREACDVVVVLGGHLSPRAAPLIARETGIETPLGTLTCHAGIVDALSAAFSMAPDTAVDNTVEILLPIVAYLMPEVPVVSVRVPPSEIAVAIGGELQKIAEGLGVTAGLVASTDLTHYGPSYGFSPHGSGPRAERWVREENDASFLRLVSDMMPLEAIEHANTNRSACSAGAAAAAVAFASSYGIKSGRLVGQMLSSDIATSSSYVGYGGVVFELE